MYDSSVCLCVCVCGYRGAAHGQTLRGLGIYLLVSQPTASTPQAALLMVSTGWSPGALTHSTVASLSHMEALKVQISCRMMASRLGLSLWTGGNVHKHTSMIGCSVFLSLQKAAQLPPPTCLVVPYLFTRCFKIPYCFHSVWHQISHQSYCVTFYFKFLSVSR